MSEKIKEFLSIAQFNMPEMTNLLYEEFLQAKEKQIKAQKFSKDTRFEDSYIEIEHIPLMKDFLLTLFDEIFFPLIQKPLMINCGHICLIKRSKEEPAYWHEYLPSSEGVGVIQKYDYWYNHMCKPEDYTKVHNHGFGLAMSACLYLKVPKDSGRIRFEYKKTDENMILNHFAKNQPPEETYELEPEAGQVICFPSWMNHGVTPQTIEEDRLSLAINILEYKKDFFLNYERLMQQDPNFRLNGFGNKIE